MAAIASITGCAMAPGIRFADQGSLSHDSDSVPQSSSAHAEEAGRAPEGALQAISAELIQRQRAARPMQVGDEVQRLFAAPAPYRIGPGDILNIVVWDHPELNLAPAGSITTDATSGAPVSNGYNVSADGAIQFPYVGSFKVAGSTEDQVRTRLATRLGRYLNEPKLTVRIQSYRSGRVYIDGAVRTPGLQALNDIPMTLPEAIHRAGGFAADADRSSLSLTRGERSAAVDLEQLAALGINPNKILLEAGDMLRVHSRDDAKVYVMGEVTRPMALPLRNGRLSLNEALGEAGGVSPTSGAPRQIYVVRPNPGSAPEIFHLDARSPTAYALSEGFELRARDVVYVDPADLVRWNRVVSLILPSAQVVNVGNNLGRN